MEKTLLYDMYLISNTHEEHFVEGLNRDGWLMVIAISIDAGHDRDTSVID